MYKNKNIKPFNITSSPHDLYEIDDLQSSSISIHTQLVAIQIKVVSLIGDHTPSYQSLHQK